MFWIYGAYFLFWLIFYSGLLAFYDLKFISPDIHTSCSALLHDASDPVLQLQSTCIFDSDVSFLQAAYHCVFLLVLLFVFKIPMSILVIKTNSAKLMLFGFCPFYQSQSFSKKFYMHGYLLCLYGMCVLDAHIGQKRVSDPQTWSYRHREPLCGCWQLNWEQ